MNSSHRSDPVGRTLTYYDRHAEAFIERTADVSMEHVYGPFLALMPPAGRILDAGCGSGRDAIAFVKRGFEVTAFDGSVELVRLASDRTGLSILHLTFDEIDWRDEFDGVWACASLLHLPSRDLHAAIQRLVHALRLGGVLYVSMKAGQSEGEREGRWFTDATPSTLTAILASTNQLDVLAVWEAEDARPGTAALSSNPFLVHRRGGERLATSQRLHAAPPD